MKDQIDELNNKEIMDLMDMLDIKIKEIVALNNKLRIKDTQFKKLKINIQDAKKEINFLNEFIKNESLRKVYLKWLSDRVNKTK